METLFGLDAEVDKEQTNRHGAKRRKVGHEHVSFLDLHKKGSNNMGFNTNVCDLNAESEFHKIEIEGEPATRPSEKDMSPDCLTGPFNSPDLLFHMIGRQASRKLTVEDREAISVEATGTAESICKWGEEKVLDIDQQKSFEATVVSLS
jgi:hypothetical protein